MAQHWRNITQSTENNIETTLVPHIQPYNDLDMKLPALDAYISSMRARQCDRSSSNFKPSSAFPSFHAARLPEYLDGPDDYKYFRLAALEDWINRQLQTWVSSHLDDATTCGKLRRLIEHYYASATAAYARSPIRMSIMYLTLAELWIACDRSACAQYSLLCQYDPELCITEFQCLLFPLKHHMRRLHEVEYYLKSRREAAVSHHPSVYRSFGHRSSFAVKYFDSSLELQATLAQTEREAQIKRARKCQELEDRKNEYANLMNNYNSMRCDTETYVYSRYHGYTATRHPSWCSRCSYEKSANALNIHIYEWPVSSDDLVAKATIFELEVPQAFSDWRDASVFMINEVLGHRDHDAEKPSCSYTLDVHQDLSQRLSPLYHQRRVVPLSQVKPYNVTHRKQKKAVHLLSEEDVCLENALQYRYFDRALDIFTTAAPTCTEIVPKLCMYRVSQRSKFLERFMYHPPSAPDGTPPNEVIVSFSSLHSLSSPHLTYATCVCAHLGGHHADFVTLHKKG